ncbi:SDR family NAD(P)-dependent oxidoreductase [Corallococcus sp. M7]
MGFDLELKGKRALVTGGTKGVGAAVVAALVKAGVRVIATARTVPGDTKDVHHVAADVTTAEGCAEVVRQAMARLGGIDILVNVLGGSTAPSGGFAALSDDDWQKELNLNPTSSPSSLLHARAR